MSYKRYATISLPLWVTAALLLANTTPAAQTSTSAPAADIVKIATTRVTALDIYPAGAKAVFSARTGENVTMEIPGAFDEKTVRAIKKTGQEIRYFRVQRLHNPGVVPDSLKELFRELEDKKTRGKILDKQISATTANLQLLSNTPISDKMNATEVGILLNNIMQSRTRLSLELTRLEDEREKLLAEISRLTKKYNNNLPPKYDSVIIVDIGAAGAGTIDVEAFTTHASWIPKYDMNFNTKTGDIVSKMIAETRLNSGITYEGTIKFYTNQPPSSSLTIPKINRLLVSFPPEYRSSAMSDKKAYANQMSYEMALPVAELKDETPIIEVTESPVNAVIAGNGRLVSDNTPTSIELGAVNHTAKPSAVMYRDFSRNGLLIANIDSIKDPVLPGAATMYVDGQFSGHTAVAYTGRGETLKLAVGYVPLMKINKETDADHSSTGFLSSSGIKQSGYSLEAVNGSNMNLDIELIDRIPFSVDDKIVVEPMTINPEPDKNEDNILTWKFHLKKGESKKFRIQYRIKHPAGRELSYQ